MSGPKRNPDRLNTIGIVVVGLCGAVLVYVTIVALQAFYVSDTSEIQTIADYGGQDTGARSLRTEQLNKIGEYGSNPKPAAPKPGEAAKQQSYRVPVDVAMKLVVQGAKSDPSSLVPAVGRSDKATVLPVFGRPKPLTAPPAAPAAAPAGGAAAPGAAPGDGSAAPAVVPPPTAPLVPTGTGTGPAPVGGAGALDKGATPATPPPPGRAAPAPTPAPAAPPARAGSAATAPKGNGK